MADDYKCDICKKFFNADEVLPIAMESCDKIVGFCDSCKKELSVKLNKSEEQIMKENYEVILK